MYDDSDQAFCRLTSKWHRESRSALVLNDTSIYYRLFTALKLELEYGPMPNVMVAIPNIGGALCSTPQSLADTHY